jgi:hypothetical protein
MKEKLFRVIRGNIFTRPDALLRPADGGGGPERVIGGQAQVR